MRDAEHDGKTRRYIENNPTKVAVEQRPISRSARRAAALTDRDRSPVAAGGKKQHNTEKPSALNAIVATRGPGEAEFGTLRSRGNW